MVSAISSIGSIISAPFRNQKIRYRDKTKNSGRKRPKVFPPGICADIRVCLRDQIAPAIRKMAATVRIAYNSGKAARINVLPITSWPLPMAAIPLAQTFDW